MRKTSIAALLVVFGINPSFAFDLELPLGGAFSLITSALNLFSDIIPFEVSVGGPLIGGGTISKSLNLTGTIGTTISGSLSFTGGTGFTTNITGLEFINGGRINNGDGFSPQTGHTLTLTDVIIRDIATGAIRNDGALTVDGGLYIGNSNGSNGGGAIMNVTLDTTFVRGGASFENNSTTDSGGAIQNQSSGAMDIRDSSFTGNYAVYYGGAVRWGGNGDIVNTDFTNNYANVGGALYTTSSSATLNITGGTFTGNHSTVDDNAATGFGGAIYSVGTLNLTDVIFDGNYAQSGGAVEQSGNIMTVIGGEFKNNYALGYGGGGIDFSGVKLIIDGTIFTNNQAKDNDSSGGAIYTNGETEISNAEFTNNIGGGGGAVRHQQRTLTISDSSFTGNIATEDGGGAVAGTSMTISNSEFDGNWALNTSGASRYNNGGAVSGSVILVENSTFTDNHADAKWGENNTVMIDPNAATGWGGAIYHSASNDATISNTLFNGNSAVYGGALMGMGSGGTITVKGGVNAQFINNTAQVGGAIFLNEMNLTLDTSTGDILFSGNKATDKSIGMGGADIFSNADTNVILISGSGNMTMDGGFAGIGEIQKAGAGLMTIKKGADNSLFDGYYTQTGGKTIVEDATSMFKGGIAMNHVSDSGILDVVGKSYSYGVSLGDYGNLVHKDNVSDPSVIDDTNLAFDGTNGAAVFSKTASLSDRASYNLMTKIDNGNLNFITFDQSNVFLGAGTQTLSEIADYRGGTKYTFTNGDISLSGPNRTLRTAMFDGNFWAENTTFSFDIYSEVVNGIETFSSDRISIANPGDVPIELGLGTLRILRTMDNGLTGQAIDDVLDGAVFASGGRASIATSAYEYLVKVNEEDRDSLIMDARAASSNKSLNNMNIDIDSTTNRGFNFSFFNELPEVYEIFDSLDYMAAGTLTVTGYDTNADHAVISGDGDKYLFTLWENGRTLNIANLTISDMYANEESVRMDGSAIYVNNTTSIVNIQNTTFDNNASFGQGGNIFNGGIMVISDSRFTNSKDIMNVFGDQGGGGIYTSVQSKTTVVRTLFDGLKAIDYGGAIANGSDAEDGLVIYDSTFTSNWAGETGGAIQNAPMMGNAIIVDSLFESNGAGDGGGAIHNYLQSGLLEISGSTFDSNYVGEKDASGEIVFKSNGLGGAIYNNYENDLQISDTQFLGNKAANAGAILNVAKLTIQNGIFTSNQAINGLGGAIINMTDEAVSDIFYTSFTTNNATGDGGAIYNEDAALTLGGNTFTGNTAGQNGGAIYIDSAADEIDLTQNDFTGNTAGQNGGAIYSDGANIINIAGESDFTENKATTNGGAVYIANGTEFNLDSSYGNITFDKNTAGVGNDIYITNANMNIGGTAGNVYVGSGIAGSADATIKMDSSGTFTFGADSKNSDFVGEFRQSRGTTNVYANNWFNGDNYIAGGTAHFFNSATAGAFDVSTGANIDLRGAQRNLLTVRDWTSDGTANLWLSTDGVVSDVLKITSGATGESIINMTVLDGGAASVGGDILVVDTSEIAGTDPLARVAAGTNDATFILAGGTNSIDIGAWVYELEQESDSNWYLKMTGQNSTMSELVGGIPALHLSIVKSGMNELRKRLGALRNNNSNNELVGAWIRGYGKNLQIDDHADSDMNLLGIEGGFDFMANMLRGKVYLGVMAGMLTSEDIDVITSRGAGASGHTRTPSVGGYLTWMHKSGSASKWFLDLTARHFWVHTNIKRDDQANGYDVQRGFWAFSGEVGKLFYMESPEWMNIGTKQHSHLSLEPKLEVRYGIGEAMDFATDNGTNGHVKTTEALSTRLYMQANFLPNGTQSTWKPYLELGVYNEWAGDTDMEFGGTEIHASQTKGFGFEATLGANATISDCAYAYGALTAELGKVYTSYLFNIGLRVKF